MTVIPTRFLGVCDRCEQAAPEERDSFEEARNDADECECTP